MAASQEEVAPAVCPESPRGRLRPWAEPGITWAEPGAPSCNASPQPQQGRAWADSSCSTILKSDWVDDLAEVSSGAGGLQRSPSEGELSSSSAGEQKGGNGLWTLAFSSGSECSDQRSESCSSSGASTPWSSWLPFHRVDYDVPAFEPAPLSAAPPAVPAPALELERGKDVEAPGGDPTGGTHSDGELLYLKVLGELQDALPVEKIGELHRDGVLEKIPKHEETGELMSVGSIQHLSGECMPCAYWLKGLCKSSVLCTFCHFNHPGPKTRSLRLSKQNARAQRAQQCDS